MVNFGPLVVENVSLVWGTPANFNGFTRFGIVTAATSPNGSQPNFARCLAVPWAGTLNIHFSIFRGLLPPGEIFPGAVFTLHPSLAFSCIGSGYCTALKQWASPTVCGVVQGMKLWNFCRGHHLYSPGRPSCWASTHILVCQVLNEVNVT